MTDLEKVKQDGMYLQYIDIQNEKLCLAAIKNNWKSLQFVKNQTPNICYTAIEENKYALEYIKNPSIELFDYIFNELCENYYCYHPYDIDDIFDEDPAIYLIKNSKEAALAAVKISPRAYQYLNNVTPEFKRMLVDYSGGVIEYIDTKDKELCELAVKTYGLAIKYVDNQTLEL